MLAGAEGLPLRPPFCLTLWLTVTPAPGGGLRGARSSAQERAACEYCRIYLDQMRRTIWLAGQLGPPRLRPEQWAKLLALFGGLGGRA
jgi:hypothetical protein